MNDSPDSQFMRSTTDHGNRVSICKKCLATVAEVPTDAELYSKERNHLCKQQSPESQLRAPRRLRLPQ